MNAPDVGVVQQELNVVFTRVGKTPQRVEEFFLTSLVMNVQQQLLLASYLRESVFPNAAAIDSDSEALRQALIGLGRYKLLGLRIPSMWGGLEVSEQTFNYFQQLVARYSGALAFLQTQHQSAAAMLVQSQNSALKQEYLPYMSSGEVLLGVGFSQLRREGEPLVKAVAVAGGYQLSGQVPWVTGWGLFEQFIIAATLPDGQAVFGVVPFTETMQQSGGAITFSQPMSLAAMTSTNTVTASVNNWLLPQERVVSIKPVGWIHANDKQNILRPSFLVLGCAKAGLDILEATLRTKSLPAISDAFESLNLEINSCEAAIIKAQQHHSESVAGLQLRAWAIDLAVRCAHAAVTVSGGSANSSDHPAQRVYREALVFTVSGQTTAVMETTLSRLTNSHSKHLKTITYSRVIHLSHIITPDIPQWSGDPAVKFEAVAELKQDGYYLRGFCMGEHSATHINAPKSFHSNGIGIEQYPAQSLVVPAVVINVCEQAAISPDYVLTREDVLMWEQQHGQIPVGCVVILHTGWQEKWQENVAFFNQDSLLKMHFPGFGSDTTQFLLNERQIAGVGIDTHGVDGGEDQTFSTNRLVLEQPRIVLENLTNLEQLPATGTTLVIGCLRLQGGSGSPVGVLALVA